MAKRPVKPRPKVSAKGAERQRRAAKRRGELLRGNLLKRKAQQRARSDALDEGEGRDE